MWFGNFAFAIDWIITDLQAIAAGASQGQIGTPSDTLDRWTTFQQVA